MSRSADIDFNFITPLDTAATLERFRVAGMSLHYEGKVAYVVDSAQMFKWVRVDYTHVQQVIEMAKGADAQHTTFGITVLLDGHRHGGDFLFHPGRQSASLNITVNRKNIEGSQFCDFSWYLRRIIPVFEPMGMSEIEAHDFR
ncbi:hypothetical protein [Streptomyces sp. MST-110588]|uniref:hypothetical protein n=1 Tax=Streptomyces sp. MST-110588 TaxID=2833628 RepID=UPI001F5E0D21|nr:hypothetical protein [Streptomyces sp. MST-110588]UNO41073.1 hypothetical protein KGS77_17630 [Streptomyces sp. MST-110588]